MLLQQLVYDQFAYANGALATVSGGVWTNCTGFEAMHAVDGLAYGAVVDGIHVAVRTTWDGSPTDQYAMVHHVSGSSGVTLRSDAADTCILVLWTPGDGAFVFEVVAGVLNLLDTPLPFATTLLFDDRCYAEIQGFTILVKQNGIELGTRTATGVIGAGQPGVAVVGATASCDEWTAGDFNGIPPLLAVGLV